MDSLIRLVHSGHVLTGMSKKFVNSSRRTRQWHSGTFKLDQIRESGGTFRVDSLVLFKFVNILYLTCGTHFCV